LCEIDTALEEKERIMELALLKEHCTDFQSEFIKNKRQKLETQIIGYGDDGAKKTDEVEISTMPALEFEELFNMVLQPQKYQDQMIQEAEEYIKKPKV
jgi:hypothetical protein